MGPPSPEAVNSVVVFRSPQISLLLRLPASRTSSACSCSQLLLSSSSSSSPSSTTQPNPTTTNNKQQQPEIAIKWFGHHKCLSSSTGSIDPWIGRSMIRSSIISSCSCSRCICCRWICLFVVCCCLFEREFDVVYFSQQLQQQQPVEVEGARSSSSSAHRLERLLPPALISQRSNGFLSPSCRWLYRERCVKKG